MHDRNNFSLWEKRMKLFRYLSISAATLLPWWHFPEKRKMLKCMEFWINKMWNTHCRRWQKMSPQKKLRELWDKTEKKWIFPSLGNNKAGAVQIRYSWQSKAKFVLTNARKLIETIVFCDFRQQLCAYKMYQPFQHISAWVRRLVLLPNWQRLC